MEFNDKLVAVTGGTRGIGRAIALHFAARGAEVTVAYREDDESARATQEAAAGLSGKVRTVKADVSSSEGAVAFLEAACGSHGYLDVLVNNAGIIRDCYLPMMADDDWDAVIRSNLYPLFHCCKWGVRKMIGRRRGAIVNLSSVSAFTGTPGQANYAASKGGIISFTKALSREVGPMGIRVNAVAPGLIKTEMTAAMKQEHLDNIIKGASLGRIGLSEEVAESVAFLASERASYITGQCLIVDGGIV